MPLISVAEAAKRYPLSPEHLRRLVRTGVVKGQRFGQSWAIDERSLQSYISKERRPGRKPKKKP